MAVGWYWMLASHGPKKAETQRVPWVSNFSTRSCASLLWEAASTGRLFRGVMPGLARSTAGGPTQVGSVGMVL